MTVGLPDLELGDAGRAREPHPGTDSGKRHLSSITKAVVLGTLVTSIVQGTLVAIGFAVLGLPSPIVFGAVAAALTLLPIGGTALVWAPAAVVLAAQGRWPSAIGLAI